MRRPFLFALKNASGLLLKFLFIVVWIIVKVRGDD